MTRQAYKTVRRETSTPENPKVLEEVVAINRPSAINKTVDKTNEWLGWGELGYDVFENTIYKGDWVYKTTRGVAQTIFDTKWGANKSPVNLGNISNYSKNAQAVIRGTKVVKVVRTATGVLVYVSVGLDVLKTINAYANNDPKAGEYARAAGLNIGVLLLGGSIPVVGWMVTGIYFLGDALIPGGWEGALNKLGEIQEYNSKILGKHWNPH